MKQFFISEPRIQTKAGDTVRWSEFKELVETNEEAPGVYPTITQGAGIGITYFVTQPMQQTLIRLIHILDLLPEEEAKDKLRTLSPEEKNAFTLTLCSTFCVKQNPNYRRIFIKIAHYLTDNSLAIPYNTAILFLNSIEDKLDYLSSLVEAFGPDIVNQDVLGQTILMRVMCSGIVAPQVIAPILQFFLQHHVRLNIRHEQLGTFLHQMIANDMDGRLISSVMNIIQETPHAVESFNFKAQDKEGQTPLLLAVKKRNTGTVIALLLLQRKYPDRVDLGLDVADYEGHTPLMLAIVLGCEEIVRLLLNQGANVNARDRQNRTITNYAQMRLVEIENILKSIHIEPQRSIHAPQNWLTDENAMPIVYKHNDHAPETLILLSHDNMETLIEAANSAMLTKTTRTEIRNQIKQLTSQDPQSILQQCQQGHARAIANIREIEEKLRQAAACGDQEKVEHYLKQGVNCNARDEFNRTALHFAVMRHERVRECLQKRTMPTVTISADEITQAMSKHADIADLLMKYGAEPLIQNSQQRSVIDILMRDKDSADQLNKITAKAIIRMLQTNHSLMLNIQTTSQPASTVSPK